MAIASTSRESPCRRMVRRARPWPSMRWSAVSMMRSRVSGGRCDMGTPYYVKAAAGKCPSRVSRPATLYSWARTATRERSAVMSLGRKTSPEVTERYAADKELAAGLRDRLARAQEAEARLRSAQTERRPDEEVRLLAIGFARALADAIAAANAAERVAMGTKTYEHGDARQRRTAQLAARRARAKPSVRPYADELDRLRTLREKHKLTFRTGPSVASRDRRVRRTPSSRRSFACIGSSAR